MCFLYRDLLRYDVGGAIRAPVSSQATTLPRLPRAGRSWQRFCGSGVRAFPLTRTPVRELPLGAPVVPDRLQKVCGLTRAEE